MNNLFIKCFNLATVLAFLPCLAGCNESASGTAIGDIAGSLGTTSSGGSAALVTPIGDIGSASLHAPEPATMLMVGTGILALRFLGHRSK